MIQSKCSLPSYCTCEVDCFSEKEWNEILDLFSDAWIYNTWAYGKVTWGGLFSHIVLKKEGRIVAAAQVRIIRKPLIGSRIAYLAWGPMWRLHGQPENPEIFRLIIRAIHLEYAHRRGFFVRMKPNEIEGRNPELIRILSEEHYRKDLKSRPYRTFICDIRGDLDDLRMNMLHKKWREKLNRSYRNNLEVELGNSDSLYERFLRIYYEMHSRKEFIRFMDVEQFQQIQKLLPESQKMRIGICSYEGRDIAALVYSALGYRGLSIFSGTANDGLQLRGAYLLRWTMIEDLKRHGCILSDQGGIDPLNNPGGFEFRLGMGGEDIQHIGQYDTWTHTFWAFIIRSADQIREFRVNFLKMVNRNYRLLKGK